MKLLWRVLMFLDLIVLFWLLGAVRLLKPLIVMVMRVYRRGRWPWQ
jgi:hypothetical protein